MASRTQFNVQLDHTTLRALRLEATLRGVPLVTLVNDAIRRYLTASAFAEVRDILDGTERRG